MALIDRGLVGPIPVRWHYGEHLQVGRNRFDHARDRVPQDAGQVIRANTDGHLADKPGYLPSQLRDSVSPQINDADQVPRSAAAAAPARPPWFQEEKQHEYIRHSGARAKRTCPRPALTGALADQRASLRGRGRPHRCPHPHGAGHGASHAAGTPLPAHRSIRLRPLPGCRCDG